MTIMEARRAQGIPDSEVLVGTRTEQLRIVGNGVARTVSMALGLSLRAAWLKDAATKPEPENQPTRPLHRIVAGNDNSPIASPNNSKLTSSSVSLGEKQKDDKTTNSPDSTANSSQERLRNVLQPFTLSYSANAQNAKKKRKVVAKEVQSGDISEVEGSISARSRTISSASPAEENTYDNHSRTGEKRRKC